MTEPGARLANRYRLEELVTEASGATLWKATDETLARLVAVWVLGDGFPRTSEVVRAARSASRVPDSRLTQVFDADESGSTAYVVEEWVVGKSLEELLTQGPLESERAAGLVAEAAEALAAANASGIYHLCLTPKKLVWSAGGAVKLAGLGIDAAIQGIATPPGNPSGGPADPGTTDAIGLGRLLYAALTGQWPGPEPTGLRPAPTLSGLPCEPSQIRAGIPDRLNEIVCRAAFQSEVRHAPPLRSSREVADALADMPRLVPIPVTAPATPTTPKQPRGTSRSSGPLEVPMPAAPPPPPRRAARASRSTSSAMNRLLIGAVATLVIVAVAVAGWTFGNTWRDSDTTTTGQDQQQQQAGVETEEPQVLSPDSANGFDPAGDGEEHNDKAGLAIDGDTSTSWNTQGYNSALFGNLKDGVGLIIDMGDTVQLAEMDLVLGDGGTSLEIRVGDEASLESLTTVHTETGASGDTAITLDEPAEGRYILVWFTELPPDGSRYRAMVHNVELRGNM